MFVILLLILVYFHKVHSLICISNHSFTISRSELTSGNDLFILKKINNKTIHSYTTNNLCHVTIFIDYNQIGGNVIIKFNFDTVRKTDSFSIETLFPLIKENDSIISNINYVCSTDDLCDQIFIETWLQRLANIKYEPLQDKLIYILPSNIQSDKCYTTNKVTQYSNDTCDAEYNSNNRNIVPTSNCLANASTTATGSD